MRLLSSVVAHVNNIRQTTFPAHKIIAPVRVRSEARFRCEWQIQKEEQPEAEAKHHASRGDEAKARGSRGIGKTFGIDFSEFKAIECLQSGIEGYHAIMQRGCLR